MPGIIRNKGQKPIIVKGIAGSVDGLINSEGMI
jgi:hypothetical protein